MSAGTHSLLYPSTKERRYANYPRRWLVEYHFDARRKAPASKGPCSSLHNARRNAARACDQEFCTVVRIFDRLKGEYTFTYKQSPTGARRYPGYVK